MAFDKVKYNNEYNKESYDRVNLTLPKGVKEKVKAHATGKGESTNAFIMRAIIEQMNRDKKE